MRRVLSGEARILVGTQMVTKGHHFPDLALVVVLNADAGLFSTDFRAAERLAQTIVQVAGRAGRERARGEVLIQTEYPEHPLLQSLLRDGYAGFAAAALAEREAARWPPFGHLALLRASTRSSNGALQFLAGARAAGGRAAGAHARAGRLRHGPPAAGRWATLQAGCSKAPSARHCIASSMHGCRGSKSWRARSACATCSMLIRSISSRPRPTEIGLRAHRLRQGLLELKSELERLVADALQTLTGGMLPTSVDPAWINVERTRDSSHGDYACNIALRLAKSSGRAPRELAEALIAALPPNPLISRTEVAGVGFINFHLAPAAHSAVLQPILEDGARFGESDSARGANVILEFVSANPTGPLHVGHGRQAAYGATLAGTFCAPPAIGVFREYYINDGGRADGHPDAQRLAALS